MGSIALTGSALVGPFPLALRLTEEPPWGPDRGGFAHRSLPCAMRKFAYSGLILMLSMALIALEILVKLTKAQFLKITINVRNHHRPPASQHNALLPEEIDQLDIPKLAKVPL